MPADPETFLFADDGETPNNPHLPLLVYRAAVNVMGAADPALPFEQAFSRHGWGDGWRNGIFGFLHFHTDTHEALGIARGWAKVEFGGANGKVFDVEAGDVVVLPAGCGHRRIESSADFLVVGAYPKGSSSDHQRPDATRHAAAVAAVARTPVPAEDPLYGRSGPLSRLWRIRN
jgi:uncharacterized protein YjlB